LSRTCTKCKNSIPEDAQLEPIAEKYPCCNKCWAEWKEYRIMVMNEMRLDMSVADHNDLVYSDILGDYTGSTEGETAGSLDDWDSKSG